MNDPIERQAAIDALADMHCKSDEEGYVWIIRSDAWGRIEALPPADPEPFIPVSWIEKYVDWLKNMDNGFAKLTAMNISTMVKKWKKEQEETE